MIGKYIISMSMWTYVSTHEAVSIPIRYAHEVHAFDNGFKLFVFRKRGIRNGLHGHKGVEALDS
jgi:hypothetical protein